MTTQHDKAKRWRWKLALAWTVALCGASYVVAFVIDSYREFREGQRRLDELQQRYDEQYRDTSTDNGADADA